MNRTVSIVMYHYVRPIKNSHFPNIKGMELDDFCKQLDYFDKKYHVITMEELLSATQNSTNQLPDNAMLLTFDDGYLDHYQYVFPELIKRNMQGSFFVPTQVLTEQVVLDVNKIHYILASRDADEIVAWLYSRMNKLREDGLSIPSNEELYQKLGKANRWDCAETIFVKRILQTELPEEVRNRLVNELFSEIFSESESKFSKGLYMNIAQMQEMKAAGMFFGTHGHGHYHLGNQKKPLIKKDLSVSIEYLSKMGLMETNHIVVNYPYGTISEDVILVAKQQKCIAGLTVTPRDANLDDDDIYKLPRWDTNDFWPRGVK